MDDSSSISLRALGVLVTIVMSIVGFFASYVFIWMKMNIGPIIQTQKRHENDLIGHADRLNRHGSDLHRLDIRQTRTEEKVEDLEEKVKWPKR